MKTHKLENCCEQEAVESMVHCVLYLCYWHQKVFLDGVSLYPAIAENTSLQLHSNCLSLVRYVLSDCRNSDPVKKNLTKGFLTPH